MSLSELMPVLQTLSRADKFRLVRLLVSDLEEEPQSLVTPGGAYPVWSPLGADEAAAVLLRELDRTGADE